MVEVVKMQLIFNFDNVRGMIVGFLILVYVNGIVVFGYYLYFIDEGCNLGGYVFDYVFEDCMVMIF